MVGSGIAGLSAAWLLGHRHEVTLFEAADRLGGHARTLLVPTAQGVAPVDMGFIVYNEATYPLLTQLFAHLGVASDVCPMTLSVSIGDGALEYAGGSFRAVLAQPWNVIRPRYLGMLHDIARFNQLAHRHLAHKDEDDGLSLGDFLSRHRFGRALRDWYLLPMAASIWSAPIARILDYPARSLLAFLANHGLLRVGRRLQWRTVNGGARSYVDRLARSLRAEIRLAVPIAGVRRLADGVELRDCAGAEHRFDRVVLATHADHGLRLLADATPLERSVLGTFRYQPNRAVLHSDPELMPRRRGVWASWNYTAHADTPPWRSVAVTYWMNRLQRLDEAPPLFVSLNPLREPAPALVHAEARFDHPVFEVAALAAQRRLGRIQGAGGVWHVGAWLGWGFHDDGLRAGIAVARAFGCAPPWEEKVRTAVPALAPEPA